MGKTAGTAQYFVELFPSDVSESRTKDLQQMVDVFWKILSEVGRVVRKELLVGKDNQSCFTKFLSTFLKLLPAPLAVKQFFRVLEDFEADAAAYEFVQSEVCVSKDGSYDEFMRQVFERYLKRD